MSRTYRRKSGKVDWSIGYDYVRMDYPNGGWGFVRVKLEGKALLKELAKWHSDHASYMGNPPKWFRQMLNKNHRAKLNHEVKRINLKADYEGYCFKPSRKTARWEWW